MAATSEGVEFEKFEQHLVTGGELLRRERVEDARKQFEAALALRPDDRKALGLLGLTCFRLSAYADALTVYQKLCDAHPTDASYRLNLGLVYLKLGRAEEAIEELKRTRELDPGMSRAVGYLGLAFARTGRYREAYEAFMQAGQADLAREMEQHLDPSVIAEIKQRFERKAAPPPPPAPRPASEPATPVVNIPALRPGVGEITKELPDMTGEAVVAEDDGEAAAGEITRQRPPAREPATVRGPMVGQGMISQAVADAMPSQSHVGAATRVAVGHEPPVPLTQFATARLIRPDDGEHPFEISAGGVLIVRVRGRVMSRTEGVIVSGGDLAYEPATRRVRGAATSEPFSGERPMFVVTGSGHMVASPLGHCFAAVMLDEDVLYLREDLVFAFQEQLRWENGHVPGSDKSVGVVQFRGRGCVAIRTRKPTLAVKLTPERGLYVDVDVLAGWVGRVVPRVVAPAAGGESSALFVECTGEGVVLLEDFDPTEPGEPQPPPPAE